MNLDSVSQRIQEGRLDTSSVITMQTLREAGLLGKKVSSGVKLLGRVSSKSHADVAVCACCFCFCNSQVRAPSMTAIFTGWLYTWMSEYVFQAL